jgi:tight adherence protein B
MGALVGLLFGAGLLLVWRSRRSPAPRRAPRRRPTAELVAQAGIEGVAPARLLILCVGAGVLGGVVALLVSRTMTIALAFALLTTQVPGTVIRQQRRRRRAELRELWPDAVDNLASAVRAGLSLPEAIGQLGERGPEPLRPAFHRFAADYRTTGRFSDGLDRLKDSLSDPVADRIVEGLRVARDVGGADLGRLLRTMSVFLRDDARARAELETRQAWTVGAARLAVGAPWAVLALLSLRSRAVAAYDSIPGFIVLMTGGLLCLVAYRVMLRIGRLPEEQRVLL